jgi:hypothetical protein
MFSEEIIRLVSTECPRLTKVRPTNVRTYEQAADVHPPGPANSCHATNVSIARFRVPYKRLTNGNFERNPFVSWGPPVIRKEEETWYCTEIWNSVLLLSSDWLLFSGTLFSSVCKYISQENTSVSKRYVISERFWLLHNVLIYTLQPRWAGYVARMVEI